MKLVLLCVMILAASAGFGQKVNLITIDEMNERVRNGKDTVFVINFWATWCLPCVHELPAFERLRTEFKNEKLKVLLVSVDFLSNLDTSVKPFVKQKGIKSEVFLLNEGDQQEYIDRVDLDWSGTLPATLFIHSDKRKFIEKEFTYLELENEYQKFK